MATVTTAIVLAASSWPFASPGSHTGSISPSPIQRIIFTDSTLVALKDAANESLVTITATLPPLFYYRISDIRIFTASDALAPFADWESEMAVLITENGVNTYNFSLYSLAKFLSAGQKNASKIDQDSVTNDYGAYFAPYDPPSQFLVDARAGSSQLVIKWLDSSADATAATQVITRIEVDQFTPVQANAAPVNSSLLTYR